MKTNRSVALVPLLTQPWCDTPLTNNLHPHSPACLRYHLDPRFQLTPPNRKCQVNGEKTRRTSSRHSFLPCRAPREPSACLPACLRCLPACSPGGRSGSPFGILITATASGRRHSTSLPPLAPKLPPPRHRRRNTFCLSHAAMTTLHAIARPVRLPGNGQERDSSDVREESAYMPPLPTTAVLPCHVMPRHTAAPPCLDHPQPSHQPKPGKRKKEKKNSQPK